jgi:hypothetical protein
MNFGWPCYAWEEVTGKAAAQAVPTIKGLVGVGSATDPKEAMRGLVCLWSLSNPEYPQVCWMILWRNM